MQHPNLAAFQLGGIYPQRVTSAPILQQATRILLPDSQGSCHDGKIQEVEVIRHMESEEHTLYAKLTIEKEGHQTQDVDSADTNVEMDEGWIRSREEGRNSRRSREEFDYDLKTAEGPPDEELAPRNRKSVSKKYMNRTFRKAYRGSSEDDHRDVQLKEEATPPSADDERAHVKPKKGTLV
ncbi:unnamed protein product [Nippostrongylus brasiliensis]|uniref:Uncharacterized protein n=1 Tax=Nippostrongylus brasiliensis TaxID=27835 RepID=A0A0N4YJ45_NIPBR|nr:unnamed protein product [Nippostrongylus brasiliensis]